MTESEYSASLSYLRERDPGHALLSLIEVKYGIVECAYLEQAIKDLPPKKKTVIETTGNATFDKLNEEIKLRYTERKKLSNSFLKTPHIQDRVEISKGILSIQLAIERLLITKAHYLENGTMPLEVNPFDIPTHPIEIRRMRDSLQQSISRYKRQIKELAVDVDKNASKISYKESKMADQKVKLQHVREALEKGI